jgi:hypothetical protein
MKRDRVSVATVDESLISEISIAPDGRVYVFGLSRQVLDVLYVLQPDDPKLSKLLGHLQQLQSLDQRNKQSGILEASK